MLVAPFIRNIRRKRTLFALGTIGAVLGDLPDIIGMAGALSHHGADAHFLAHNGQIKEVLQFIPMCTLHFFLDSYTEGMLNRWSLWNDWVRFELMLWTINLIVVAVLIMIWRRVQERRRAEARFHISIN